MKLKAFVILLIILLSLIPVYILHKYVQQKLRPRESMKRLLGYMLLIFLLVFAYTFLLVFTIKQLFPGA
jgi:hypothetical protein